MILFKCKLYNIENNQWKLEYWIAPKKNFKQTTASIMS